MNKFIWLWPIISTILGMTLMIISVLQLRELPNELHLWHIPFCLSLLWMGLSWVSILFINQGDDMSWNE